jgi:hypothetical protein
MVTYSDAALRGNLEQYYAQEQVQRNKQFSLVAGKLRVLKDSELH